MKKLSILQNQSILKNLSRLRQGRGSCAINCKATAFDPINLALKHRTHKSNQSEIHCVALSPPTSHHRVCIERLVYCVEFTPLDEFPDGIETNVKSSKTSRGLRNYFLEKLFVKLTGCEPPKWNWQTLLKVRRNHRQRTCFTFPLLRLFISIVSSQQLLRST